MHRAANHLFKSLVAAVAFMALLGASSLGFAQTTHETAGRNYPGFYSQPPRFQIYTAPEPYGGLVMVDTETGESWQRLIVNTKNGISIRWLKLSKDQPIKEGEAILWK